MVAVHINHQLLHLQEEAGIRLLHQFQEDSVIQVVGLAGTVITAVAVKLMVTIPVAIGPATVVINA